MATEVRLARSRSQPSAARRRASLLRGQHLDADGFAF